MTSSCPRQANRSTKTSKKMTVIAACRRTPTGLPRDRALQKRRRLTVRTVHSITLTTKSIRFVSNIRIASSDNDTGKAQEPSADTQVGDGGGRGQEERRS